MAITRKPINKTKPSMTATEVENLINKGGSIAKSSDEKSKHRQLYIQLRLTEDLIQKIDRLLKIRPIKIPRHTWFLEAIYEKLERESIKQ